jgi:Cu/Ag efflux protein CusF
MRPLLLPLIAATILAACGQPQTKTDEPPATAQSETPIGVHSSGTVVAITREYSAITIQHAPIPEFQMDAMTMEFTVADASELDGLNVGDRVTFDLSGPIDIRTIRKADD